MVKLRDLARDDIPVVNQWRQDRLLTDPLGSPPRHISLDVDLAWFEEYLARRGTDVRCAICLEGDAAVIGLVSITAIHPINRSGEFHLMIGRRDLHGRGLGTAATGAMIHHGFCDLNLRRIYLSVLESNLAAVHIYEKVGFRHEGRARDAVFKNGRYQDLLLMAMLASEFTAT
jgi:diamine N-acetyltransferase